LQRRARRVAVSSKQILRPHGDDGTAVRWAKREGALP
jgi:hypothetical protein